MTGWVRFENTMPEDAKLPGISDRAFRLWVNATCYCSRGETNGKVPASLLTSLSITGNKRAVVELVKAGLLLERGDHYEVHNYLKFNPSKERIGQLKEAGRSRQAKHRNADVTRDSAEQPNALPLTRATAPLVSSADSFQGERGLTRELVDEATAILSAHWPTVDEMAVENCAGLHPDVDLLQGCRLAVTWASDESWEMQSCPATLRAALRKLDAEKPKLDEGKVRRQRRGAALEGLMARTEPAA